MVYGSQPLNAKILTNDGFINIKDINIGDKILTPDGVGAEITDIIFQKEKEIFSIEFTDRSIVECCKDQLWFVKNRNHRQNNRPGYIKSLEEISKNLYVERGTRKNYSIPEIEFKLNFIKNELLEIDPYLLGALLGDGGFSQRAICFTNKDQDIIEIIKEKLNNIDCKLSIDKSSKIDFNITKLINKGVGKNNKSNTGKFIDKNGLRGCKSDTKFIPVQYKLTTIENRISILQGLFDTDGSATKKNYSVEYSSASTQLTNDVMFLVRSLGGIAYYYINDAFYTYKKQKLQGKDRHRLSINMPFNIEPFRMERKLDIYKNNEDDARHLPRYIENIKYVKTDDTVSIMINHPKHLYITNDFIIIHDLYQEAVKKEKNNENTNRICK